MKLKDRIVSDYISELIWRNISLLHKADCCTIRQQSPQAQCLPVDTLSWLSLRTLVRPSVHIVRLRGIELFDYTWKKNYNWLQGCDNGTRGIFKALRRHLSGGNKQNYDKSQENRSPVKDLNPRPPWLRSRIVNHKIARVRCSFIRTSVQYQASHEHVLSNPQEHLLIIHYGLASLRKTK